MFKKRGMIIFLSLFLVFSLASSAFAGSFFDSFFAKFNPTPAPTYYTFEDLVDELGNWRGEISFDASNPPQEAMAQLPSHPAYAAEIKPVWGWGEEPQEITIGSFRSQVPYFEKGGLVFIKSKSNNKVTRAVRNFSTWTHVAMAWDNNFVWVFDSLPDGGVQIREPELFWEEIVTVSLKRVKGLSVWQRENLVEEARQKYEGLSYFPDNVNVNDMSKIEFARKFIANASKWGDKVDTGSMYCSKLVWATYLPLVDLDSNRTKTWKYDISSDYWYMALPFKLATVLIGVSPDEVYYSQHLEQDLVLVGEENLDKKF